MEGENRVHRLSNGRGKRRCCFESETVRPRFGISYKQSLILHEFPYRLSMFFLHLNHFFLTGHRPKQILKKLGERKNLSAGHGPLGKITRNHKKSDGSFKGAACTELVDYSMCVIHGFGWWSWSKNELDSVNEFDAVMSCRRLVKGFTKEILIRRGQWRDELTTGYGAGDKFYYQYSKKKRKKIRR